jgi:hypothetical protein
MPSPRALTVQADTHWSDSPWLLLTYGAVVVAGLTATLVFAFTTAPLAARVLAPAVYVVLVTFGTRAWKWSAFYWAMILAVLAGAGIFVFRPIDPAQCAGWNRKLSETELSQVHMTPGTTVAELFTGQVSGNVPVAFQRWRSEGGRC